jgi:deoxyhypusine monooxygenase
MFERYRALFTLREINTKESCEAICQSLLKENFANCSALLKHEVAFVLAQMEKVFHVAVPYLLDACKNPEEAPIVKHEGLVAVGEMIDDEKIIEDLLEHPDPIVSESCAVAINNMRNRLAELAEMRAKAAKDMEEYEKSQKQ